MLGYIIRHLEGGCVESSIKVKPTVWYRSWIFQFDVRCDSQDILYFVVMLVCYKWSDSRAISIKVTNDNKRSSLVVTAISSKVIRIQTTSVKSITRIICVSLCIPYSCNSASSVTGLTISLVVNVFSYKARWYGWIDCCSDVSYIIVHSHLVEITVNVLVCIFSLHQVNNIKWLVSCETVADIFSVYTIFIYTFSAQVVSYRLCNFVDWFDLYY